MFARQGLHYRGIGKDLYIIYVLFCKIANLYISIYNKYRFLLFLNIIINLDTNITIKEAI